MTVEKISNVSLSKAREMCPGMSEEIYALTDYLAEVSMDELVPEALAGLLVLVLEDIETSRNTFEPTKELPEYLIKHKNQVLAQSWCIPQVVDVIADSEFAKEFREICKDACCFDPPKRVNE